ncbi:MAG: UDP-N-acetylglucosamine 2-epimerase [Thermoflexaceae bacterium]|nr:UDP-N-acetylglucosamine 2-epimerase [Thermoflexaceae bacterium]
MKKIIIITSTRAEYGLLSPVIKKLKKCSDIEICVAATGTHLSAEYGMTVREIENDGVCVDAKIDILCESDRPSGISKTMANALERFSNYFEESQPDAIMILGDRYEMLAIASAALNARIPIIHIHGGEATEGAADEYIRNAITKLSYLHFASTETYRKRIIQMGEHPDRVHNVGALGVENCLNVDLYSREELTADLQCDLSRYAVLTFHPVTMENYTAQEQIKTLMEVVSQYSDITFICTKANSDQGGKIINECITEYANTYSNIRLYDSLGMRRYLSAVKYAEFVIGNSSSGIIEVPSFGVATVNIGDRQRGRIQAESIVNCEPRYESIKNAMTQVLRSDFRERISTVVNPYEQAGTSDRIVKITENFLRNNNRDFKKKFYDIDF